MVARVTYQAGKGFCQRDQNRGHQSGKDFGSASASAMAQTFPWRALIAMVSERASGRRDDLDGKCGQTSDWIYRWGLSGRDRSFGDVLRFRPFVPHRLVSLSC